MYCLKADREREEHRRLQAEKRYAEDMGHSMSNDENTNSLASLLQEVKYSIIQSHVGVMNIRIYILCYLIIPKFQMTAKILPMSNLLTKY